MAMDGAIELEALAAATASNSGNTVESGATSSAAGASLTQPEAGARVGVDNALVDLQASAVSTMDILELDSLSNTLMAIQYAASMPAMQ